MRLDCMLLALTPSVGADKRAASHGRDTRTSWRRIGKTTYKVTDPKGKTVSCLDPHVIVQIPSRCVVVDIDCEKEAQKLGLNDTAIVRTPNGQHFWYWLPDGFVLPNVIGLTKNPKVVFDSNSSGEEGDAGVERSVDFLVKGHYVCVPPSPGYKFVNNGEIEYIPRSVMDAVLMAAVMYEGAQLVQSIRSGDHPF